jgi:hypothetical protein
MPLHLVELTIIFVKSNGLAQTVPRFCPLKIQVCIFLMTTLIQRKKFLCRVNWLGQLPTAHCSSLVLSLLFGVAGNTLLTYPSSAIALFFIGIKRCQVPRPHTVQYEPSYVRTSKSVTWHIFCRTNSTEGYSPEPIDHLTWDRRTWYSTLRIVRGSTQTGHILITWHILTCVASLEV